MNTLLYGLLKVYFSHIPGKKLDFAYRKILIIGIFFYRLIIRPFIKNRCQFLITCSQFTLELIKSQDPFDKVSLLCLERFCECSLPFDRVRTGEKVIFLSHNGRQIDTKDVSREVLAKIESDC